MSARFRAWTFSAFCLFGSGCDDDPGRVLVVVDTDFDVPGELSAVRVLVRAGGTEQMREIPVSLRAATPHQNPAAVPLSFVVAARDDASRDFEVTVSGLSATTPGEVLVTRRAITSFLPERTLLLPMFLLRSCSEVVCVPDQTCFDGSCVDPRVPAQTLATVQEPGRELTSDAGVGMDAAIARDAGVSDAAVADAGRRDGGTCAYGVVTPLISLGSDWDPTVTGDEMLLVWTDGDTRLIESAVRAMPLGTFTHDRTLPFPDFEPGSVVSPVISSNGLSILVEGTLTSGGIVSLYQLSRADRITDFGGVFNVVGDMHAFDPALDRTGLNLVAHFDVAGRDTLMAGTRTSPTGIFTMFRPITELGTDVRFPALSGDGLTLAFTRDVGLPGMMDDDIFVAHRPSIDAMFDPPMPVDGVNSATSMEHDPWLSDDASTIYFSSTRSGSSWDLYFARGSCF